MAFNTKYYIEHESANGVDYRLEIQQDGFSGTPYKATCGDAPPFSITMNDSDIYSTVTGSGMDITLLSEYPLQYLDLYAVEMFTYKVRLFRASELIWVGWLDTEMYEEPYGEAYNYPVTFTANDGMALLSRLKYIKESDYGFKYGLDRAMYVIFDILDRLALEYNGIYVSTSHELMQRGVATPMESYENTLHKIYVDNENYLDELEEPMDMRAVLEEILKPLGLKLRINPSNASVYIYDYHLLARGDDMTFKKYALTGQFLGDVVLTQASITKDISTDLGCNTTDATMTYTNPINKQTINYSPYRLIELMKQEFNEEDFCNPSDTDCDNYIGYEQHGCAQAEGSWVEWHYHENPDLVAIGPASGNPPYFTQKVLGVQTGTITRTGVDYYAKTLIRRVNEPILSTTLRTPTIWGYHNPEDTDFAFMYLIVDFEAMINKEVK